MGHLYHNLSRPRDLCRDGEGVRARGSGFILPNKSYSEITDFDPRPSFLGTLDLKWYTSMNGPCGVSHDVEVRPLFGYLVCMSTSSSGTQFS